MSELIPRHGGYRSLKSFQLSQLVYDETVRFADSYIDRFSRTKDQMVQATRSGVQNIAEGSEASATSKKTELKLTQVARASLEELKLDYEDFLRQRELPMMEPRHPALMRFKQRRCGTLGEVQDWVAGERERCRGEHVHTDGHGRTWTDTDTRSVPVSDSPCSSVVSTPLTSSCLAANAALSLLNLACWLLDRQVDRLAGDFENEGGFTERLYRVRTARRGGR